jgi:hypothetical protein
MSPSLLGGVPALGDPDLGKGGISLC